MGVQGLWSVLEDACETRSWTSITFDEIDSESKCFRLGIDASIWFFHAEYGKEGENPELRTLFFRCGQLLSYPVIPVFIFDGPKRPEYKRGKRINRSAHKLVTGMKQIIEAYGFQHRTAPGEAEAELAYLNSVGILDGVLTDDVDTFLFGGRTVIRNASSTHATAKSDAKKSFARIYRNIPLTRADLILVALCSGGDYNQAGLLGCGIKTSVALAQSGLSQSLYDAATTLECPSPEFTAFLDQWRALVVKELATNASGLIGRKMVALSKKVPDTFPEIEILRSYTHPMTSASAGRPDFYREIARDWTRAEPSLPALAAVCEFYFEWGFRESIVKRSRTLLWPGIAFRVMRRYLIDGKTDGIPAQFGEYEGEQKTFMRKIHSSRKHQTTDHILEYRVEIDPSALVRLVESGVKGTRRPDDNEWSDDGSEEEEAKKANPDDIVRVWLRADLVRRSCPDIAEAYDEVERKKEEKKNRPKGTRKKKATVEELSGDDEQPTAGPSKKKPVPKAAKKKPAVVLEELSGGEAEAPSRPADMRTFFQAKKHVPGATASKKAVAPKPPPFASFSSSSSTAVPSTSRSSVDHSRPSTPPPRSISPSKLLIALDSATKPKKTSTTPVTPRPIPKAFPMTFSPLDVDSDSDLDVEVLPPMTPSPMKSARKNMRPSSFSSEEEANVHKSPRRGRLDSPKNNRNPRRDASPVVGRTGTATSLKKKPALVLDSDVIEISSDDEPVAPRKPPVLKKKVPTKKPVTMSDDVHPLLRARAMGK